MHRQINTILSRLRQDLARHFEPEPILAACRSVGHAWRNTTLNPVDILRWFVTQVLHGNTSLEHVSLLGGRLFTGSAYCQARARLPLFVFREVLRNLVESLVGETHTDGLWRGHRTLLIDGSAFSMPDTPELQKRERIRVRSRLPCEDVLSSTREVSIHYPIGRLAAGSHKR